MKNYKNIPHADVFAVILLVAGLINLLSRLFINQYVDTLLYSETLYYFESILILFIIWNVCTYKNLKLTSDNENALKHFIHVIFITAALELLFWIVFNKIAFINVIYSKLIGYSILLGIMLLMILVNKKEDKRLKDIFKAALSNGYKALIIIFIIVAWLNSTFVCIAYTFIDADICCADETAVDKISTIYEQDDLIDARSIVYGDRHRIIPMDINLLNDEYKIEALKYFHNGYYAMYQESDRVLLIHFDNMGKSDLQGFIDINGNSENINKISFFDTVKDVGKYFTVDDEEIEDIQSSFYHDSWYYTEDGYLVTVNYLFGRVISISKWLF